MVALTNSRFITHPSIAPSEGNIKVVLVDANDQDIQDVSWFCGSSNKNYDVYLYQQDIDDFPWLHSITNQSDYVLINHNSKINISGVTELIKFGEEQQYYTPRAFLEVLDNSNK